MRYNHRTGSRAYKRKEPNAQLMYPTETRAAGKVQRMAKHGAKKNPHGFAVNSHVSPFRTSHRRRDVSRSARARGMRMMSAYG